MDKEFEKWLKQDEMFDYYINNPDEQEIIFRDYQREKEYIAPENIEEWVDWLVKNPELAEKHYPLLTSRIKKRIKKMPPFFTANIIQKLPELFPKAKLEYNEYFGEKRRKTIIEHIELIKFVLNDYEYTTEIERQAVESVRPELLEQLKLWEKELTEIESTQKLEKEFDKLADEYKEEYGHDIPWGSYIFEFKIKPRIDKIQDINQRINEYKKEKLMYHKRSLSNSYFIGETEITKRIIPLIENEIQFLQITEQEINNENPFSVLEWATIFYYADETKLLSDSHHIKNRMEYFMKKHQLNTTFDNFKTKYYEAKKRINEKNNYPVNKLKKIIPFLKDNYKQTVTKVENELSFLEENNFDY